MALQKMPQGSLKKFVDAGKNKTRVITAVERHILSAPVNSSRRSDALHPSAMASDSWCHRQSYFLLRGYTQPNKQDTSLTRELIFEEGHRIHKKWQQWFRDMGKLYGMWQCKSCQVAFWGTSPAECVECGFTNLKYREVPVEYSPLRILGHADGWLKGFGDDLMLEIKSVGEGTFMWYGKSEYAANGWDFKKAWAALEHPFPAHSTQAQIYMHTLELSGYPNPPKEAVVIYEAKPNQEVKEFVVPKSMFSVKPIFDAAEQIIKAVDTQTAPECNVGGHNRCKACRDFNE